MPDDPVPASPQGGRRGNPFDTASGYSGQDYHRDREAELARQDPAVGTPGGPADTAQASARPEAGRQAYTDPATGEVHGSGSGAGGGNAGEDHDDDAKGGSGYLRTGTAGESPAIQAGKSGG